AAVQMINSVYLGGSLGRQTRNNQRGGCPQIARHYRRAAQGLAALDDRAGPLDGYVRSESSQFRNVREAGFKDPLSDDADPRRENHQGHHLSLNIRWKTGVGQGGDIDWF